ncbi:nucleoside diphosphate-linked moiety X motif 19-like [Mizuhopecten yessoensis]|uniref:Nucleoside diphosphate-linked moiety X motif 19, mitochondrial n=1 Tax=Mizuhopecten yessoensis TaxID=6573 RepID=A0A210QXQ8_MIZYE|nr:nucleoside diphosphate-linked moiety X motif 19-like [Mizuhopecten yessoensis]OWF53501.1 Nucleoside diphosphate-linked moiety X motif 19, mitochondrial [Mizuhopecten yessoensis]
MAAILKHWREAATLILVAKRAPAITGIGNQIEKCTRKKYDYDILMLKRSSKSKFMPKLYVFPGGAAHDVDFSKEWVSVFKDCNIDRLFEFMKRGGTGQYMFSRRRTPEFEHVPSELAFRICAIRETFEESGVLLVRNADGSLQSSNLDEVPVFGKVSSLSDSVIQSWRQRVNKDAKEFLKMCQELQVVPDVWSLNEWANWLTPVIMRSGESRSNRRFDTAFYLCVLDHMPPAIQDNTETVHAEWSSPDKIMNDRSEEGLAPPQVYELCRMLHFTCAEKLNHFAWTRAQTCSRVERYFPVLLRCNDGVVVVYPGDELYPEEPDCEGKNPMMSLNFTVEEIKQKYPRMNRGFDSHGRLEVNVQPKDGHKIPLQNLSSIGMTIAKL